VRWPQCLSPQLKPAALLRALARIASDDEAPIARYVASDSLPGIWALHPWAPTATNAAYRDLPIAILWNFQLADS
jgi:hypothetical protein